MNAVRTKLKQLVKENGGEKQRSSLAQRKVEDSAKKQAEQHSDLLMRFFESEVFDAWIAVRYVCVLSSVSTSGLVERLTCLSVLQLSAQALVERHATISLSTFVYDARVRSGVVPVSALSAVHSAWW